MILYGIEIQKSIYISIGGTPKREYKKGEKVVVVRDDYLRLLKYGGKRLGQVSMAYKDVESQLKKSVQNEKKAAEEIAAEKQEEAKKLQEIQEAKRKEQEEFDNKQAELKKKHEVEMKKLNAERLQKAQKAKEESLSSSEAAASSLEKIVTNAVNKAKK